MKHRGFILWEALICALLVSMFAWMLLQAYGSSLYAMRWAKIIHERFNNEELSKINTTTP